MRKESKADKRRGKWREKECKIIGKGHDRYEKISRAS